MPGDHITTQEVDPSGIEPRFRSKETALKCIDVLSRCYARTDESKLAARHRFGALFGINLATLWNGIGEVAE